MRLRWVYLVNRSLNLHRQENDVDQFIIAFSRYVDPISPN